MADDPLFGDFSGFEREARRALELSNESVALSNERRRQEVRQGPSGPAGAVGGGGNRGGGTRPPTTGGAAPPPGGGSGDADREARRQQAFRQALTRSNLELQRQTSVLGSSSQALRRHGALTTEFISAAARGEASYREWGYQIGATAAKFAGWTAVSIPIFAALDGVRQIGTGAIQSASGVDSLRRVMDDVNPDQLQGQLRDLSREFNVPIEVASDAVYRMGQRFHNQADAVNAARAALYSYKTGEVDVATSTRYLNAITSGFGLTSKELIGIYDQINQAQNRFGITIGDTEAGMARAAGAFRNAGGEASYLLAMIAAMRLATGRTGENVGTAIQRSIGFIQRPSNQEQLRAFGIDPTGGIEEIYSQAFKVAQGLQGEELQRLATALSSPQYASYFVPLLKNYEQFQQILAETSPQQAAGSANRELEQVLNRLDERIQSIGNTLQRLGSALMTSGLSQPLLIALTAVSGLLTGVTELMSLFSSIPRGPELLGIHLRDAAVFGFQLLAAMRLMQRFSFGEKLTGPLGQVGGNRGFLRPNQEVGNRREVGRALREEQQFLRDERERRARAAAIATAETDIATQRSVTAAGTYGHGSPEHRAAHERAVFLRNRAAELAIEEEAINQRIVQSEQRSQRFRTQVLSYRTRSMTATEFAGREQIYLAAGNRPTTDRPYTIPFVSTPDNVGGGAPLGVNLLRPGMVEDADERARKMKETDSRMKRMSGRMGTAARNFAGGLRGAALAMGSMFGPFEIILAAAIGLPAIFQAQKENLESFNANIERTLHDPSSLQGIKREMDRLRQEQRKGRGWFEDTFLNDRTFGEFARDLTRPGDLLFNQEDDSGEQRKKAARDQENRLMTRLQTQNRMLRGNQVPYLPGSQRGPRSELTPDVIDANVKDDLKHIQNGIFNARAARARLDLRIQEINLSRIPDDKKADAIRKLRDQFANAMATVGSTADVIREIENMTGETLEARVGVLNSLADVGRGPGNLNQQRGAQTFQQVLNARRMGPRGYEDLAKHTKAMQDQLRSAGQHDFDRAMLFARNQEDRDRAWRDYNAALDDEVGGARRVVRRDRRDARAAQRKEERERQKLRELRAEQRRRGGGDRLDEENQMGDVSPDGLRRMPGANEKRTDDLTKRIRESRARVKRLKARSDAEDKELNNAESELRGLERERAAVNKERQRERFQQNQAVRQARTQANQYRYRQGAPRMRYLLRQMHEEMIRTIREFGRDTLEGQQAIAEYRAQQEATAQAIEQETQAREEYGWGAPSTDLGRSRSRARGLRGRLRRRRRAGASKDELYGIMSDIRDTERAAADMAREEAKELADSLFDLRISRTEDPVKIARIELQRAQSALKTARTPAERNRARAEVNTRRRAHRDAIVNSAVEDAQFMYDMGRMTTGAFRDALQKILDTQKMGKEARRNIMRQIRELDKELNQENELELAVGNIRLPTTYEIRRGLGMTGAQGGNLFAPTTNNNNITIIVADKADVPAVGEELDKATRSGFNSTARARGII